jgi:hypothetical protein
VGFSAGPYGADGKYQINPCHRYCTRRAQEENVCIYSYTRTYGEMIPANEYIEHMQKALKMIDEEVGGDLNSREDSEIITGPAQGRPPKLFTLNF